ncbi:MAG: hypothetical protein R3336_05530, partial [Phycisphaeraceae bacterium]|nr:hypothetical protein [Phycisphaeraceae bacterium]
MNDDERLNVMNATAVADCFHRAAEVMLEDPRREGARVTLPAAGTLTVAGDLHDQDESFRKILIQADLDASDDRYLVMQEVVHGERRTNGRDMSVRTLARVAEQVVAYPGRVWQLQSNHELAQVNGESIHKDGVDNIEAFTLGLQYMYRTEWETVQAAMAAYIRALPLAVETE